MMMHLIGLFLKQAFELSAHSQLPHPPSPMPFLWSSVDPRDPQTEFELILKIHWTTKVDQDCTEKPIESRALHWNIRMRNETDSSL